MNKTITLLGVAALLSMTGMAQKTGNEIHIDFAKKGAEVPAGMFGIFSRRSIIPEREDYMPNWFRTVLSRIPRCLKDIRSGTDSFSVPN